MCVNLFDVFFFIVVMLFELHWFLKSRKEEREFEQFKATVHSQLTELGQRLEIAIEGTVEESQYGTTEGINRKASGT